MRVETSRWRRGALAVWTSVVLACGGSAGAVGGDEGDEAQAPEPIVPTTTLAPVSRVDTADAWLDLVAQRPSAVSTRLGRVVVDMGHPSAHKHLELAVSSPWRVGENVDGRRGALLLGRSGTLTLPLDGELAPAANPPDEEGRPGLAIAITLRALSEKQMVTVLWNERPLANLRVSESWSRRTLSLPDDLVRPGENRLRLHFRHAAPHGEGFASAAVELVEVGTREMIVEGAPPLAPVKIEDHGTAGVRFGLPSGSGVVYYLVPPRRARLRLEAAGRGGLQVLASTDADHAAGRKPTELLQEPLRPTGRTLDVDLSGYARVPTRLEIRVQGSPDDEGATIRSMSVSTRRQVPVDSRKRSLRSVYVIGLEGVRPDALRQRVRGQGLPNIERLLDESLVFGRAYAPGAAAIPSHAAWLASVVPPAHLTVRGTFVAEAQTLLPEVLDRAGYFTVGVSANTDVNAERGLVQGVADHKTVERTSTRASDAEGVMRLVLEQIDRRDPPRFVYAILSDAQAPWDPPSELLADLGVQQPEGGPLQHLTHMWVGRVRTGKVVPAKEHLEWVRQLYFAELRVIDGALGRLLTDLENRGELDESIVVLVGVHGEEFLEHGSAGHGRTLYEESIRVPLAIRAPELLAPGRVDAPVDLLDLAPTLADLLGLDFPSRWQGESLVPLIDDPQPPPNLVLSHLGDGSRAAIVGNYKLVLGPGRGPGAQRFVDLGTDPSESEDRLAEGGVALRMVRTALAWEMLDGSEFKRGRWGSGAALAPAFALDHGM